MSGKPATEQIACTVLKPPTNTIPNENNMKIPIHTSRLTRLGCWVGRSRVEVNAETMYADEDTVVARKMKHDAA